MATPSWLDDAAAFATCATLTTTGSALVGTGVSTLWAGGGGLVPLSLGMLSFLAAGAACNNTPVDGVGDQSQINGCSEISSGGFGEIEGRPGDTGDWAGWPTTVNPQRAIAILDTKVEDLGGTGSTPWAASITWRNEDGTTSSSNTARFATQELAARWQWRLNPVSGTCSGFPGDPTPLPPTFTDPVQYTDASTNCTYNISPQGFVQETEGGQAGVVFKIEAAGPQTLASGSSVGGCNFEPTLVYRSPNSPNPYTIPWDPTWPSGGGGGTPPWLNFLSDVVGGVLASAIYDKLKELTEPTLPAGSKEIYAACEFKQDGTPETFAINFPEENFNSRVLTALDAIVDFQQQFFLWKTPICSPTPTPLTGEPVTINWISEQPLMSTGNYLKKIFTYFDQSGRSLAQHVDHWRDFSWDAGPVVVSCARTPLGKPQVWAASEAEGKRVINHAAAIAGVDTTNAEWLVGTPKSTRYGNSGRMRVHVSTDGLLGITKRDGPSGLPPALP